MPIIFYAMYSLTVFEAIAQYWNTSKMVQN